MGGDLSREECTSGGSSRSCRSSRHSSRGSRRHSRGGGRSQLPHPHNHHRYRGSDGGDGRGRGGRGGQRGGGHRGGGGRGGVDLHDALFQLTTENQAIHIHYIHTIYPPTQNNQKIKNNSK